MKIRSDLQLLNKWLLSVNFRRIRTSSRKWLAYAAPEGCNVILLVPLLFGKKDHEVAEFARKIVITNIVRILNILEEDPQETIESLFKTICFLSE